MQVRGALVIIALTAGSALAVAVPVAAAGPEARAAVVASYVAEFHRDEPNPEWTGNVATCTAGTTSLAHQQSVLRRVNWFRDFAGLPPVVLEPSNTVFAQAAAIINSANGKLTHTPAPSAKCYTVDGKTGANQSSLALGGSGVVAIGMYMDDFGENNKPVGHRNWLLSPRLATIATGDTFAPYGSQAYNSANALYQTLSSTAAVPRDGAVAWPPAGFVPSQLAYDRWSYHRDGADFSTATVTVTGPEGSVPVTIDDRVGWLGPGIVFVPKTVDPTPPVDRTYIVSIEGIGGTGPSSIVYPVTMIRVNNRPVYVDSEIYRVKACAAPGTSIILPTFDDADNDRLTYSLSGPDAANYRLDRDGEIELARNLTSKNPVHRLTLTATDPQGASVVKSYTYTYRPVTSSTVCPVRNVKTKVRGTSITVSWTRPPGKVPRYGYTAILAGGMQSCTTKKTSCVIRVARRGTYSLFVDSRDSRGAASTWPMKVRVR